MTDIKSMSQNLGATRQNILQRAEDVMGRNENVTPFSERMGDAIRDVADSQKTSADLAKAYELGIEADLSKVMVAQQVSSVGFQLVMNVRNKFLSAYKDIMNTPV
jgi:flagellar hook-basal body complex protein FliE